jgi:hypothetical protein
MKKIFGIISIAITLVSVFIVSIVFQCLCVNDPCAPFVYKFNIFLAEDLPVLIGCVVAFIFIVLSAIYWKFQNKLSKVSSAVSFIIILLYVYRVINFLYLSKDCAFSRP